MTDDHIDTEALRAKYPLDSAERWEVEGRYTLAEQRRDFHRVLDALEAAQAERDAWRERVKIWTQRCVCTCRIDDDTETVIEWCKVHGNLMAAERSAREQADDE